MNFLATTPDRTLVIDAPSWFDARRYALAKLGADVRLEPTTHPAHVTLTHHGNDFTGNVKKHLRASCPCSLHDVCAEHEIPETIHYPEKRPMDPIEMTPAEIAERIGDGKTTIFGWIAYAADEDEEEDGVWIQLSDGQVRTLLMKASVDWDTIPAWDRDSELYVGLGPEPE